MSTSVARGGGGREDASVDATQEPEVIEASEDGATPTARAIDRAEPTRVEQPGKLMRLAVMIRETLEEVRRAPLDQHAREHLAQSHTRIIQELRGSLPEPLVEELDRLTLPFDGGEVPSEASLRVAQAQLLGWLEGLFQGIQAAIASQQAQMVAQLDEMRRRSLPAGPSQDEDGVRPSGPGQYL